MNTTQYTRKYWSPVWVEALAVLLLLALVCLLVWPMMKVPWMLDDLDQMTHVSSFTSWIDCFGRDSFGLFRPFKNLVYYGLGDLSLFNWHALNLAVYLCAVVAVYLLLRRLLGSSIWAFSGALLWATCPTQVSTAGWMSAVNISLSVILTCACLSCHDRSRERSGHNVRLTTLACLWMFLAQCSYETAVIVPALCLLADALRKRLIFSRAAMIRYASLAAVTLVYLAIRFHIGAATSVQSANLGFAPNTTGWQLSLSAPWFLWRHFSMWFMPLGRIEFASTYIWGFSASPWELIAAWLFLLLLIGMIFFTRKRQPWVAFGLLWFLITSFPSSNFIPVWSGPIEDYYLVFPGIGLAIALLGCAKTLVGWINRGSAKEQVLHRMLGRALLCIGGLWRVLLIPLFWWQASLWCRPIELFLNNDLTRPGQFQVQALAAKELYQNGYPLQAKELALKSYQIAPWYPSSSMLLGCIALDAADYDEAEKRFSEAIRIVSENSVIGDYLRLQLAKTLMHQDSKRYLTREILLPLLNNLHSSYHLDAIALQVDSYLAQNKPSDARRAAAMGAQLHPDNPKLNALLKTIEKKFPSSSDTQ